MGLEGEVVFRIGKPWEESEEISGFRSAWVGFEPVKSALLFQGKKLLCSARVFDVVIRSDSSEEFRAYGLGGLLTVEQHRRKGYAGLLIGEFCRSSPQGEQVGVVAHTRQPKSKIWKENGFRVLAPAERPHNWLVFCPFDKLTALPESSTWRAQCHF